MIFIFSFFLSGHIYTHNLSIDFSFASTFTLKKMSSNRCDFALLLTTLQEKKKKLSYDRQIKKYLLNLTRDEFRAPIKQEIRMLNDRLNSLEEQIEEVMDALYQYSGDDE